MRFRKALALTLASLLAMAPMGVAQQRNNTEPRLTQAMPGILPSGTVIKIKLETGVSTAVNKVGDGFSGRVTEDVIYQGATVIPVGSSLAGVVTKVDEKRRYKGRPVLELRPETVTLPNGDKYNIIATVTQTERGSGTSVDSEGRIKGSGIDKRDKIEMAAGAGGGALIGGLSGQSAKGTFVGAIIGGGAAVGYWLSKKKSFSLTAGTEIVMELSRPMSLTATGD